MVGEIWSTHDEIVCGHQKLNLQMFLMAYGRTYNICSAKSTEYKIYYQLVSTEQKRFSAKKNYQREIIHQHVSI